MDEARAAMRRALELDPLLLVTNVNLGRIDYYEGRYDQAIKQYQRALELDKDFMRTHLRLGLAYVQQGRYQEALSEYNKALEIAGDTPQVRAHIAHVMAVSGKKTEALAALAELQEPVVGVRSLAGDGAGGDVIWFARLPRPADIRELADQQEAYTD